MWQFLQLSALSVGRRGVVHVSLLRCLIARFAPGCFRGTRTCVWRGIRQAKCPQVIGKRMHLRDDTTNALGLFRKCSGFDQAKLRRRNRSAEVKCCPLSSAPELSLDGSRWEKLRRMWSTHYFVLTERLDVCRCSTRGGAHRYGR